MIHGAVPIRIINYKRINIWKSVSIPILIRRYLSFCSCSLSLKTANLKSRRISREGSRSIGRELFVLILWTGSWRSLRLEIRKRMVPPFFIARCYTLENLSKRNSTARSAPSLGSPINFIATGPMCTRYSRNKV